MNQSIIGVIVFFVFLSTIEASSNPSFIDSISIPGAKCIISIPMDSNSLFSSFEHPCSNYYFFKCNYRHVCSSLVPNLWIEFSSSVKCTLFLKPLQLGTFSSNQSHPSDTLPLLCDTLKYYTHSNSFFNSYTDSSFKDSLDWYYLYACLTKRLAKVSLYYMGSPLTDLLHFILKSASDSSEVYLSRTILQLTQVKSPLCKATNNIKSLSKAYTLNGALIQLNRKLPSVYILKDNAKAQPTVHLRY